MRRPSHVAVAALLGVLLMGCNQTIDRTASWYTGLDCKLDRIDRDQKMCVARTAGLGDHPLYCYKTLGGVECYARSEPYAEVHVPGNAVVIPVNTLALRDFPPGIAPGGRPLPPDLSLANPEGRDGAQEAVKRELAALQAKIEAERIAVAVPLAPTLSEPLVEPPKVEAPKKAPPKRNVRRSTTGQPRPITRQPRPAPAEGTDQGANAARPLTDAEGAALADRQNNRQ